MRIAIQGEIASFHDTAAKQWFGSSITPVACDTFSEVFGALNRHEADAAVVAIENLLYGGINQVYDLIEAHGYPIVGEVHLPVHQQLIGTPDSTVTHIFSHPVALAQCENFLDTYYPSARRVEHQDTAGAVRHVAEQNNPHFAAIASREAAEHYGLSVVHKDTEDNPANFTRFLIIQPNGTPPSNANRTSLVLTTDHTPGALAKILTILADNNINLSKLQSRPIVGKPWHYRFYLVLDTANEPLARILPKLRMSATDITILGKYKHNPVGNHDTNRG